MDKEEVVEMLADALGSYHMALQDAIMQACGCGPIQKMRFEQAFNREIERLIAKGFNNPVLERFYETQ